RSFRSAPARMSEHVRARKSLGQNFLTDPNIQRKIVAALDPQPQDTVVEIGPGLGALTEHLLGNVERLIAIELDDRLAHRLQQLHGQRSDFNLLHEDALQVDLSALQLPAHFKVVGNIPYNITTPLLFKLLERCARPAVLIVMVQKEVAQRISAPPGNKEYGALSVGIQSIARVERLFNVGAGSFRPVPGVDSTVLRITPFLPPPATDQEESDLRSLTRTLFGQRRKQIQSILRNAPGYLLSAAEVEALTREIGVEPKTRPEQLSTTQFANLARALRARGRPHATA
ncbi:MAG: 16S rRNA (adenine(1518)-N(6)/adenine(1519)-N(6))-dimethyltransferase RsmA, partial [Longimicrobiales bacterium]